MESFNATYSDGKIKIVSNTYWYTNCIGNINLSKYSGEGNDEITVLSPNGISYVQGTVYFSYGGKYCTDFPSIDISAQNSHYFDVVPQYVVLNGKGSTAIVTVNCNNDFSVSEVDYDKYSILKYGGNKIMVISKTDKEFGCDPNSAVTFVVNDTLYPNSKTIGVYQCFKYTTVENECNLNAYIVRKNDNITYDIIVDSRYNGIPIDFTYDYDNTNDLTITKVNYKTLHVIVKNTLVDSYNINLHNQCDSYTVQLMLNNYYDELFDVAAKCDGLLDVNSGTTQINIASLHITDEDNRDEIIAENRKIASDCSEIKKTDNPDNPNNPIVSTTEEYEINVEINNEESKIVSTVEEYEINVSITDKKDSDKTIISSTDNYELSLEIEDNSLKISSTTDEYEINLNINDSK